MTSWICFWDIPAMWKPPTIRWILSPAISFALLTNIYHPGVDTAGDHQESFRTLHYKCLLLDTGSHHQSTKRRE